MFSFDRQQIQEIIFNAEINSANIGTSAMDLLSKYSEELSLTNKGIAQKIDSIVKSLSSGTKRWDAYKQYVDEDILNLLRMAEENSIPAEKIINSYVPIKNITNNYLKTIKRSLIGPIVGAVVITLILGYTVSQFKNPIDSGMVVVDDYVVFIASNYYLLNFSFLLSLTALLIFIPHKLPVLKGIFKKLDSMMSLAIVKTMILVGYSSSDIIPIIKKQFKISFDHGDNDINGLVKMLKHERLIKPEEAAEIKITMTQDDPIKPIERFINQRKNDGEQMTKEAGQAVSTIAMIMTAVPILMMVIVMVSFLAAAASLSQGGQ